MCSDVWFYNGFIHWGSEPLKHLCRRYMRSTECPSGSKWVLTVLFLCHISAQSSQNDSSRLNLFGNLFFITFMSLRVYQAILQALCSRPVHLSVTKLVNMVFWKWTNQFSWQLARAWNDQLDAWLIHALWASTCTTFIQGYSCHAVLTVVEQRQVSIWQSAILTETEVLKLTWGVLVVSFKKLCCLTLHFIKLIWITSPRLLVGILVGSSQWAVSQGFSFRCTMVNVTSNKVQKLKIKTCFAIGRNIVDMLTSSKVTRNGNIKICECQQQTNVHHKVCTVESVFHVYEKCSWCDILWMLKIWQSSGVLNCLCLKTNIKTKTKTITLETDCEVLFWDETVSWDSHPCVAVLIVGCREPRRHRASSFICCSFIGVGVVCASGVLDRPTWRCAVFERLRVPCFE